MPKDQDREIRLPSLDELFSSQKERDEADLKKIYEIPLDEIDPFPDHPFKVRDDEDMMNLVESVRTKGVLTPCTVRKKEDGRYELLSGHRRMRACELAGIDKLRCEIVDMSRDEATVFMVESNFQRSTILPSEKAFAYKMRLEAMNRQGKRTDLTSGPMGPKSRTNEELGQQVNESATQIKRYIRLTELIPDILELVDDGKIGLRPAVELSYIPKDIQGYIYDTMDMEQCTPTHAQARRMRALSEENKLTEEVIEVILMEEKPNQKEKIVLRGERFRDLFPKNLPLSKREDYVAAAMEHYGRYLAKREREMER
ncbi:MAG: ParB/RepB/Spo0J family partition protein [Firmicutes bacterium]|nr:ParB/RepB/Spo0J family partition protein [Bacillota bacterium]